MTNLLSSRYAQAYFDFCLEKNHLEAAHQDLQFLKDAIEKSLELRQFLGDPIVSDEKRQEMLRKVFSPKLHKDTLNFVLFVAHKKRSAILKAMCDSFEQLYTRHKAIMPVKITSNTVLSKSQTDDITSQIKTRFKKDVKVNAVVDAGLLGGMKIQIDDKIYDLSLKTQLQKFKEQLIRI